MTLPNRQNYNVNQAMQRKRLEQQQQQQHQRASPFVDITSPYPPGFTHTQPPMHHHSSPVHPQGFVPNGSHMRHLQGMPDMIPPQMHHQMPHTPTGTRGNAGISPTTPSSATGRGKKSNTKNKKDAAATSAAIIAHRNQMKEEMTEIHSKFDKIVTDNNKKIHESKLAMKRKWDQISTDAADEHSESDMNTMLQFKKRRLQGSNDTSVIDTIDAEQVLQTVIMEVRRYLQDNDKLCDRVVRYIESNQEHLMSLITKNPLSGEDEDVVDYDRLKSYVSNHKYFQTVYSYIRQMMDRAKPVIVPAEAIANQSDANVDQTNAQNPALIEMTPSEILLVFVGKDQSDKQEEVNTFIERFLALQTQYKEEAEYVYNAEVEWSKKYERVLNEQSKLRYVSPLERDQIMKNIRTKFSTLLQNVKDKYLSKVFSLQESVLMRSKKRGNLPKHATNTLKTWLFSNFLHPYPSESEKLELSQQTGLSITQINNWFINARVRTWRPMLESMLEGEKERNKISQSNPQLAALGHLSNQQIADALNNNGQNPPPGHGSQTGQNRLPAMQQHMQHPQHMSPVSSHPSQMAYAMSPPANYGRNMDPMGHPNFGNWDGEDPHAAHHGMPPHAQHPPYSFGSPQPGAWHNEPHDFPN